MEQIFLEDHQKHIVFYAKGWYRRSGDIMQDLKVLLSGFFGIEPIFFTDSDIYGRLLELFSSVKNSDEQLRFWGNVFARVGRPTITMTELVELLVGEIRICVVRKNGNVVLDLGEPDYTIFPSSQQTAEQML